MTYQIDPEVLAPYRDQILQRIRRKHIRTPREHGGRLLLISDTYPGYWLEHLNDAVCWATLHPEDADIAASQVRLFLGNQKPDGRLPSHVLDNDLMNGIPGMARAYTGRDTCPPGLTVCYGQLQECVSVASLCLKTWKMNPCEDLWWYYDCCSKWDAWLCANRMTRGKGLVETFCGFDTGHDNSGRFAGLRYPYDLCSIPSEYPEGYPVDCDLAPLLSPDVNAVFYGNRMALAEMAQQLGMEADAAAWRAKAAQVKEALLRHCFDPETYFFYDVDKHDRFIPVKSVSITTLFAEHLLDGDMAEEIWNRYLANPAHFGTAYAFPGASVSDPTWVQQHEGNSWGFYAQGNVALRTLFWMEHYGKKEQMLHMMAAWLSAWCRPGILEFGQELHPVTGEPSACARWYSTTMLYLLCAMREHGMTV